MKVSKFFWLFLIILFSGQLFAQDNDMDNMVDTRVIMYSKVCTNDSVIVELDLQLRNDGTLTYSVKGCNDAFQLSQTIRDLNPRVTFIEPVPGSRLFPGSSIPGAVPYQQTEDYNNTTGRVRFIYTYNSGAYAQVPPTWTTICRVRVAVAKPTIQVIGSVLGGHPCRLIISQIVQMPM